MAVLLQIKLKIYFKLRQKIITNYGNFCFWRIQKLLQTTSSFITNSSSFKCHYELREILLEVAAGIANYDVITNYVVTMSTILSF